VNIEYSTRPCVGTLNWGLPVVTLRLFGPPVVRDADGREVQLRSRKQLGVLVYLMVERDRAIPRAELMEAFWGDVSRERAYQSLCQALVEIRRRLGREAVQSRSETIRLGVPSSTDIETLAQDLERRDLSHPLQEMDWWGTPALGHWIERSRAWAIRMARTTLLRGITDNRLAGATLRVHRCAELLYAIDPLSEAAVLALTERELLKGDVVGGIRLLRAHLARIAETLGCQPQPAVERLRRRLEAGAHPPVELVPKRLAAHASRVRPAILVARERELACLEGEWQRVQNERTLGACVVTGVGGIGKSSVVRRFAATVAARAQPIFVVSCQEIGAGIPFAAAADLVEELLRDPAVSATDPVWLAEVSRIHPAIRQQYPGVPEPLDAPAETIRLRIAEGIMRMIEAIADGGPVGLVFDDLLHMDPATRDVVAVLTKRARELPVLVVGTARIESPHERLREPILDHRIWQERGVRLHLDLLDGEGVRRLVSTVAPSLELEAPLAVARIITMSEGNPHFVEFLVSDWQRHETASLPAGASAHELPEDWTPPESLRDAFAQSYDTLHRPARQILQVLAVAQRALGPDELSHALSLPLPNLDQAVLELLAQGLLRLEAGQLGFKSELHRAFAYFVMSPDARLYHHGILARSIRDWTQTQRPRQDLEAGLHFLLSGDRDEASRLIEQGARDAIRAGAPAEAEAALEALARATTGAAHATSLLILGESQLAGGRPLECIGTLNAIHRPDLNDGQVLELELLMFKAVGLLRNIPANDMIEGVAKLLESSLAVRHVEVALSALQLLAEYSAEAGATDRLESLILTCQDLLHSDKTQHAARAALSLGFIALAQGAFLQAEKAFRSGASLEGVGRHFPLILWRLLSGLSLAQTGQGDYEAAEETIRRLEDSALSIPGERNPILWSNIAVFFQERGYFNKAIEYFGRAVAALPSFPGPREHSIVYSSAASLALDLGHGDLADECLQRAEAAISASLVARDRLDSLLVRADLHLARRERELAWRVMRESVLPFGDRIYAMGESARHERLMRNLILEVNGPREYHRLCGAREDVVARLPLHGRIEVECFDEWASEGPNEASSDGQALNRAIQGGFAGVILHLAAIGCLPRTAPGEPHTAVTAQQLAERFPLAFPEGVPEDLELPLPAF